MTHPVAAGLGGAALVLALAASSALAAEPAAPPQPAHVLQLSASATRQVPQDWLTVVWSTTREGSEPAAVQSQLRQALDAALAEARRAARGAAPQAMEVQTGAFSLMPRYGKEGRMVGWSGRAELLVQGRDSAAIAQLVGRITTLTVQSTAFSLSREAREQVEDEVAAEAIARFRARADAVSRQFGYAGWTVREIGVQAESPVQPYPRAVVMRAQAAAPMADESLPVEAGKSAVTATVAGSVTMTR